MKNQPDQLYNLWDLVLNENIRPLVQKAERKILKYKAFTFLLLLLSSCHGGFYLLFNIVLSKEKLQF